ncbi:alpha-hydroxy-acid oxidizing protein [Sinirhodobacter sp. WL0062]|uniref:Alpha-hydroxy-acid oxidizing protein n=1 Tax=Rhodobacter flavimaris TaxID=2907145 RepID=A0ABS8YUL4_9RHOB|nr:alpha-hydroxy acid oxidase [Sinirhodobacter sp. WL0062]MCE5973546.1 alpha-hydroxy-acid oxidizing protein [Sinirhodobacter sp. WL0062]
MHRLALDHYEPHARDTLSAQAYAYVSGGAGHGAAIRRNREAWGRVLLDPALGRRLRDLDCGLDLFGRRYRFPCLVAPMAYQLLAHPDGERATALAAAAQGAGFVLSCQTSLPPDQVAAGPFWFQLYLQPDRRATRALVEAAIAAGAEALVVTMDAPLNGIRNAEIDAGFALPDGVRPVMLDALPAQASRQAENPIAGAMAAAPDWADLATLCAEVALPVLAKGVMSPASARAALEAGCAGVIVSNHGGRVLEGLPATAQVLPQIRAAFPHALILVDGGIRSGEDLFRALALGADAALLGRPVFYALALGGAQGVSTCLRRLHDEFAVTMGLMGCERLAEITAERLYRPEVT